MFSLFSSQDADRIMALTANKSNNDLNDSLGRSRELSEVDISGWQWFDGNSKNITEKLKYGLKVIRSFIKVGDYIKAIRFNME